MNTQIVYELNNNKARNVNEIDNFVEMEKFTIFASLFTSKKKIDGEMCALVCYFIDRIEQNELCDFWLFKILNTCGLLLLLSLDDEKQK